MTTMIGDTFSAQNATEAAAPKLQTEPGMVRLLADIGLTAIATAGGLWVRHSFAGQALKGRVRPLRQPAPKFAPYTDVQ